MASWVLFTTLRARRKKVYVFSCRQLCAIPLKREIFCTRDLHLSGCYIVCEFSSVRQHKLEIRYVVRATVIRILACLGMRGVEGYAKGYAYTAFAAALII